MEQTTTKLFAEREPFAGFQRTAPAVPDEYSYSTEEAREAAHRQLYSLRQTSEEKEAEARREIYTLRPEPEKPVYGRDESLSRLYPNAPQKDYGYNDTYITGGTDYRAYSQARPFGHTQPQIHPQRTLTEDDLMPSADTMRYARIEAVPETVKIPVAQPKTASVSAPAKSKLVISRKGKITIAVYAAVVTLLIALVAVTAAILSGLTASAVQLEQRITQSSGAIIEKEIQLEELLVETNIYDSAIGNGMGPPSGPPAEIKLLPVSPVPVYAEVRGWFDVFCDWLSGLFGG